MSINRLHKINKTYIFGVSALTFLLPFIGSTAEALLNQHDQLSFAMVGKWFIFSAVGLRLFIAGIKQTTNPAFTAKQVFHLNSDESHPILRELGFANLCFGLIGIGSLFMPEWRVVSAFGSGLYYGMAGIQHLLKKEAGTDEKFAMVTDIIIFIFLAVYFVKMVDV